MESFEAVTGDPISPNVQDDSYSQSLQVHSNNAELVQENHGSTTIDIEASTFQDLNDEECRHLNIDPEQIGKGSKKLGLIEDRNKRSACFTKRRGGLMKKAHEIGVLTGCDVLMILASRSGNLYTYNTPPFDKMVTEKTALRLIENSLGQRIESITDIPFESCKLGQNISPLSNQLQWTSGTKKLMKTNRDNFVSHQSPGKNNPKICTPYIADGLSEQIGYPLKHHLAITSGEQFTNLATEESQSSQLQLRPTLFMQDTNEGVDLSRKSLFSNLPMTPMDSPDEGINKSLIRTMPNFPIGSQLGTGSPFSPNNNEENSKPKPYQAKLDHYGQCQKFPPVGGRFFGCHFPMNMASYNSNNNLYNPWQCPNNSNIGTAIPSPFLPSVQYPTIISPPQINISKPSPSPNFSSINLPDFPASYFTSCIDRPLESQARQPTPLSFQIPPNTHPGLLQQPITSLGNSPQIENNFKFNGRNEPSFLNQKRFRYQ